MAGIQEEFGGDVTVDMVSGALRRKGLAQPGAYLAKLPDLDYGDEVTLPNATAYEPPRERDTQPAPAEVVQSKRDVVAAGVFFGDVHCGIQDDRAVECAIRAAEEFLRPFNEEQRFTAQVGDLLDCEDLSSHPRRKNKWATIDEEIEIGRNFLSSVKNRIGAATNHLIGGNHDSARWEKYVSANLRTAASIRRIGDALLFESLLGLDELGWSYTRYNKCINIGRCVVSHDFGSGGATAISKCLYGGYRAGSAFGHTHRPGVMYAGMCGDTFRVSLNPGWLGRLEAIDYFNERSAREQWAHAIVTAYLDADGMLHAQVVPIVDAECIVNGRRIAA